MENTVTISLEKYEEMKNRIEYLEKENEKKTIIKTEPHWTVGVALILMGLFIIISLSHII